MIKQTKSSAPTSIHLAVGFFASCLLTLTGCTADDQQLPAAAPVLSPPVEAMTVKSIVLPAEDLEFRESALPGRQLAVQKCTICHSVDYIHYQAPGLSLQQWTGEVGKMQRVYGAPLSAEEIQSIGAYLAVAYGSANASDADVQAAALAVPAEPASGSDVQSLLNSNACLGCHAIDSQLVGPSFSAVAERYRDDPQARAKVAANIFNGGIGKWGQVPMPPMANLSEAQAEQLATYVLAQ